MQGPTLLGSVLLLPLSSLNPGTAWWTVSEERWVSVGEGVSDIVMTCLFLIVRKGVNSFSLLLFPEVNLTVYRLHYLSIMSFFRWG